MAPGKLWHTRRLGGRSADEFTFRRLCATGVEQLPELLQLRTSRRHRARVILLNNIDSPADFASGTWCRLLPQDGCHPQRPLLLGGDLPLIARTAR